MNKEHSYCENCGKDVPTNKAHKTPGWIRIRIQGIGQLFATHPRAANDGWVTNDSVYIPIVIGGGEGSLDFCSVKCLTYYFESKIYTINRDNKEGGSDE